MSELLAEREVYDEQHRIRGFWNTVRDISGRILAELEATVRSSMFLRPKEIMAFNWDLFRSYDFRPVLDEVERLTGLSIISESRVRCGIISIDTAQVGITDTGLNLGDAPFEKLFAQSAENKRLWDENLQTIADEFLQQIIQSFNKLEYKCFGLALRQLVISGYENPPIGFIRFRGRQFHYASIRRAQLDQIVPIANSRIAGGWISIEPDAESGRLAIYVYPKINDAVDPVFNYRAIWNLYNDTVSSE